MVATRRRRTRQQEEGEDSIGFGIKPSLSPEYGTPEGRIPFGDGSSGWSHTPETIEPNDCVNYPDSPLCGGNPFTRAPVGLDIEVNIHPCGVDVNVQGTLGFVKLPVHGVSYRRPGECRYDPPQEEPPTPEPGKVNFEGFDINVNPLLKVFCFITNNEQRNYTYTNPGGCGALSGQTFPTPEGWTSTTSNYRCPGDQVIVSGRSETAPISCDWNYSTYATGFKSRSRSSISGDYCHDQPYQDSYDTKASASYYGGGYIFTYIHDEAGNVRQWKTNDGQASTINYSIPATHETSYCEPFRNNPLRIWRGYYRHIKFFVVKPTTVSPSKTVTIKLDYVVGINCAYALENPYANNPPPPPPPPKKCCMSCCTPTTQQSDNTALLQLILAEARKAREEAEKASADAKAAKEEAEKANRAIGEFPVNVTIFDADENSQEAQSQVLQIRSLSQGISRSIERVEKVAKIIGIDALPLTVPVSIVEPVDQNMIDVVFDFFTPDTKQIHNLFEFLAWMVEQDNAVLGKWQQKITIEDTDATKEGNQKKDIAIVDLSHAIREIIMQELQNYKLIGLMVDMVFKLLVECASTKQEVAKILAQLDELIQWTGMSTRTKALDCPIQITPLSQEVDQPYPENATDSQKAEIDKNNERNKADANNLHKWLQPSHTKITYQDWDGHDSLTEQFIHLATLLRKQ
jgi:hypothetical protein